MTQLADIQGRIASMDELQDIVGAMRSLAGMRMQEAQNSLPGIRRYAESMATAIGAALTLMPEPRPERGTERDHRAIILCMAEHGFVGGFNERLIDAAQAQLGDRDVLLVLGSRGAALVFERGRKAVWTSPMATRLTGVTDIVNRLAGELYGRIARGAISRVEVMFGRYRQGTASTIERRLLLPLDTAALAAGQPRQAPLHNLEPQVLLERLMAEYVFALLTEATVESMASENAARFAAMGAAHDNVSKKLSGLRQDARQARQSEITSELLDLMTGAEAMRSEKDRTARHAHLGTPAGSR
jgi:F-type H+-transporting ATPase subunit gamma